MKYQVSVTESESEQHFQRVSKDLLVHNAAQGVNYWGGSPHPTMLIWAGRIYDFLKVLEGLVGHLPARRHSYLVGYGSGFEGAKANREIVQGENPEAFAVQLLLAASPILAGAGWGRCAIEYERDEGTITWEFPSGTAVGLAARLEGIRERPACAFMAGYVAGWTNQALGTAVEFRELECVARGDARCLFRSAEFLRFRP